MYSLATADDCKEHTKRCEAPRYPVPSELPLLRDAGKSQAHFGDHTYTDTNHRGLKNTRVLIFTFQAIKIIWDGFTPW